MLESVFYSLFIVVYSNINYLSTINQSNLLHTSTTTCIVTNQIPKKNPVQVIVSISKHSNLPNTHSYCWNYFRFYSDDDVCSTFLHLIFIFITHIEVYLLLRFPFDIFFCQLCQHDFNRPFITQIAYAS